MEKLNTRSLPGATGFSLQGGRGDPPLSAGSPPKSFQKFDPPVPTPNPLPNSFVFMQFLAIFFPPCHQNPVENPALEIGTHIGLVTFHSCKDQFFDFSFFVFYSLFQGQKIHKSVFWPQKWPKKRPKNQEIKNLTPAIVESHETNVCTNF